MRPLMQNYTLKEIKNLTYDVFELTFSWENEIPVKPWQFITFMIDWVWARAYSILEKNEKNLKFIIKKVTKENGWRWWSIFLCEQKVWNQIKWIWASWNFLVSKNEKNKLFLATWTWLVPIFYQIKSELFSWAKNNFKLIFWVRLEKDLFFIEELNILKENFKNFDFEIFLSNEENPKYKKWYVTESIYTWKIDWFEEIYLCGNPLMIDSAKEIAFKTWFLEENIFDEKY